MKRDAYDWWLFGMLTYLLLAIPIGALMFAAIMRWAPHP